MNEAERCHRLAYIAYGKYRPKGKPPVGNRMVGLIHYAFNVMATVVVVEIEGDTAMLGTPTC